jgi:hypothetical protein
MSRTLATSGLVVLTQVTFPFGRESDPAASGYALRPTPGAPARQAVDMIN